MARLVCFRSSPVLTDEFIQETAKGRKLLVKEYTFKVESQGSQTISESDEFLTKEAIIEE